MAQSAVGHEGGGEDVAVQNALSRPTVSGLAWARCSGGLACLPWYRVLAPHAPHLPAISLACQLLLLSCSCPFAGGGGAAAGRVRPLPARPGEGGGEHHACRCLLCVLALLCAVLAAPCTVQRDPDTSVASQLLRLPTGLHASLPPCSPNLADQAAEIGVPQAEDDDRVGSRMPTLIDIQVSMLS